MFRNHGMLRILLGLTVLLALSGPCQSQVIVIRRDHLCEGASPENPCTWDTPACESAWQPTISAVFLGRAAEIREEEVPILLDGEKALTGRLFVTFEVEEGYIGVPEKTVTVTSGGDLCGYPFYKGDEYLVYGRRLQTGEIYVSSCSSTKWKSEAAEDLKYLRTLSTAAHGGTIYGTAFRYKDPENPRMMLRRGTAATGQKISIRGPNQDYEVVVDARGKFTISALPPGRYTVLVNSHEVVSSRPSHLSAIVDLADKGCAKFDFWIDPFAKKDSEIHRGTETSPAKQTPKNEHSN
jgi:hypothetical protein